MSLNHLLLQCRAGFEKEAAAEITDQCANIGIYGYCRLNEGDGYVLFVTQQGEAERAVAEIPFGQLIFIRQWMVCGERLVLPRHDRITTLLENLEGAEPCADLWVEYPDTTEGRELATFARKFGSATAQALRKVKLLRGGAEAKNRRMVIFATSGETCFLGYAFVDNSSPWKQGIPRLKFPKSAPSRSTLKLEEAWHWFIPRDDWDTRIPHGSTAVDLGAAPGGWSWQLVQRSMFVAAVDNGPMNDDLMETGQVNHVLEDAYRFVPDQPVKLMVCDVVDKPVKTAAMASDWVINGWCEEAIFNLKLPMKQRYQEVVGCLNLIAERFMQEGLGYELASKHLYHDREEITCHLRLR